MSCGRLIVKVFSTQFNFILSSNHLLAHLSSCINNKNISCLLLTCGGLTVSFRQVRPHLELTFDNILAHINTVYVLNTNPGIMDGDSSADGCPISLRLKVKQI